MVQVSGSLTSTRLLTAGFVTRKWRWRLRNSAQEVADCHDHCSDVSNVGGDELSLLSRTQLAS